MGHRTIAPINWTDAAQSTLVLAATKPCWLSSTTAFTGPTGVNLQKWSFLQVSKDVHTEQHILARSVLAWANLAISLHHSVVLNMAQVQTGDIQGLVGGCAKLVKWNPSIMGVWIVWCLNRDTKTCIVSQVGSRCVGERSVYLPELSEIRNGFNLKQRRDVNKMLVKVHSEV